MTPQEDMILAGMILIMASIAFGIIRIITVKKKIRVELVIREDVENKWFKIDLDDLSSETVSQKYKGYTYKANLAEGFKMDVNFIDSWFRGIRDRYLIVFHEFLEDKKIKAPQAPKALSIASVPKNTAEILLIVKNYRGVDPALDDQFKNRGGQVVPDWLLIVIVAVVIIVVGFIAWSQGWLNPDTFKKTKLLSVLLWRLKNA